MKRKAIRKSLSFVLSLVILLSMSCVVFAAEGADTNTRNGYILEGYVQYFASTPTEAAGEMWVNVDWSGNRVQKMYATGEVVDYYTGASLLTTSNNSSNSTSVAAYAGVSVLDTRKVTVYGCGEIRDSFSLLVYPTIYGTFGKPDGTR